MAISLVLDHPATPPGMVVFTDSDTSLNLINRLTFSVELEHLVEAIRALISQLQYNGTKFSIRWVPGHVGNISWGTSWLTGALTTVHAHLVLPHCCTQSPRGGFPTSSVPNLVSVPPSRSRRSPTPSPAHTFQLIGSVFFTQRSLYRPT